MWADTPQNTQVRFSADAMDWDQAREEREWETISGAGDGMAQHLHVRPASQIHSVRGEKHHPHTHAKRERRNGKAAGDKEHRRAAACDRIGRKQ